jgi:sugar/nucleoside kinase (ribokinase family)
MHTSTTVRLVSPFDAFSLHSQCSLHATELAFISGVDVLNGSEVASRERVRQAVAALRQKFTESGNKNVEVLVTLGAWGSIYFPADWACGDCGQQREVRVGRFALATDDGKPRDTTGAGDAYRGSFVSARYGEGKSIVDAMRWAAAAGSLSVEVEGAMPSMAPRDKIAQRLACAELGLEGEWA